MAGMSNFLEVSMRTHIFRTGTFAKPTALFVALHTADPADDGSGAEVSGGSYARVQRDPADANWTAVSATDGVTTNAAVLTFATPSANWGSITHVGVWTAITGGDLIGKGVLTDPKTVNNGDPAPSFQAGALIVAFA